MYGLDPLDIYIYFFFHQKIMNVGVFEEEKNHAFQNYYTIFKIKGGCGHRCDMHNFYWDRAEECPEISRRETIVKK